MTGYDWIYDVLGDVHAFAEANDLPDLAAKVQEALGVAKAELARRGDVALVTSDTALKV
jgi:hypothetical protein